MTDRDSLRDASPRFSVFVDIHIDKVSRWLVISWNTQALQQLHRVLRPLSSDNQLDPREHLLSWCQLFGLLFVGDSGLSSRGRLRLFGGGARCRPLLF